MNTNPTQPRRAARPRWPSWVTWVLMFMLFPGAPEAFADLGHLAVNADWAHHDDEGEHELAPHDEDERHAHGLGDEHGCSGLFHTCRCCPSPLALPLERRAPIEQAAATRLPRLCPTRTTGPSEGHVEPPFRPPAA